MKTVKWYRGRRVRSRLNPKRVGTIAGTFGTFLGVQWDDRVGAQWSKPYFNEWGGGYIAARTWRFARRADLQPMRKETR